MIETTAAAAREPLGCSLREVDCRGSRADDDVSIARRASFEQVERQIHEPPRLDSRSQRSLDQELQIGRLADLAWTSQDMDAGALEVDRPHLRSVENDRVGGKTPQMRVVRRPSRARPPRIERDDLLIGQHSACIYRALT